MQGGAQRSGGPGVGRALARAALALALTLAPGLASAQQPIGTADRTAARELGEQGVVLYEAQRYAEALDKLTRAHAVVNLTTTGLWRARCLEKLGRLVEAAEQYLEVARMKLDDSALPQHREALAAAGSEREALLPRIPHVVIAPKKPLQEGVAVSIDDKPVPAALVGADRPVDPGHHVLLLTRGSWRHEQPFDVAEGAKLELPVAAEPPPDDGVVGPVVGPVPTPEPPSPEPGPPEPPMSGQAIGGWVLVALGGAGMAAGTAMGAVALDRKSSLDANCPDRQCPPTEHGDVDLFYAMRIGSTASLAVGGAALLGGIALVLTAPPGEPTQESGATSLRGSLGPGSARFALDF